MKITILAIEQFLRICSVINQLSTKSVSDMATFNTLSRPCEIELDDIDFLPILTEEHIKLLFPFYVHLKNGFGKASEFASDDEQYNLKIDRTVNAIIGWNVGDKPYAGSPTIEFYTPECVGLQPYLNAIMFKMSQLLGLEQHVQHGIHEQEVQNVGNRSGRFVDFFVPSPFAAEFFSSSAATQPVMLGAPILVKMLGKLAEKVEFFFDFGGIGADCTLVGLTLSMGSIFVVVLELSGVGTQDVSITTKQTKPTPLFDNPTGVKICEGGRIGALAPLLEFLDEQQGMAAGFGLLARTLMSAQRG